MAETPFTSKHARPDTGSTPDPVRELLLQTYDSVLTAGNAIYCSAPITSGKRYIEWVTQAGGAGGLIDDLSPRQREQHRSRVIEPNRSHARDIVDRLRQRSRKPVIDPTVVGHIGGWRQADWISFWEEVIARFVSEVVFVDGWEYSYGCTHEFLFATNKGIPTLDETGSGLLPSKAAQQITAALPRLRAAGIDATKFDRILSSLRSLAE